MGLIDPNSDGNMVQVLVFCVLVRAEFDVSVLVRRGAAGIVARVGKESSTGWRAPSTQVIGSR
jgi:hypothetical protein